MLPRLLAGKFHACLKLPLTDIDPLRNYEAGVLHVKGAWAVYTRDIAREHSNGLSLQTGLECYTLSTLMHMKHSDHATEFTVDT